LVRNLLSKAAALIFLAALSSQGAFACQIALALTVDVSGSIDGEEYALQMDGLADALSDPTVADALVETQAHLLVMQWSGTSRQTISIPWRRMADLSAVAILSDDVRRIPRQWRNFSTAIGDALLEAGNSFADVPHCERRVIDVSGDGLSNEGFDVEAARNVVVGQGIVINGLAIEGAQDNLTAYFRDSVIGGLGSFVVKAGSYADYPRAIRRKLLNEVTKPVT